MNAIIKNSILFPFNILYRISPETDLKILFALKQHYPLHLEEPETYNEKLQWLKLYDRNPLIPLCCDKYLCREYITRCGLQKLLVPLYWEGFDPAKAKLIHDCLVSAGKYGRAVESKNGGEECYNGSVAMHGKRGAQNYAD